MASPISSMPSESSTPGPPTLRPKNLFVSAPMMQATSDPSSTQEFSSSSLPGFTSGAQSSSLAIDAPSQMIQIPPAHVIEAAKPPPPRILKLSHEELDAWRQILTLYKQQQINTIQTHSAP